MKQTSQSGFSTLQIILALTATAVVFGLISTFSGSPKEQVTADTSGEVRESDTPIETYANNKAAELVAPATEAITEKNEEIKAEMDVETVETPIVESEPVVVETAPTPEPVVVATAGTFTEYDESKLAADGTNVLFFHADWCPSCRGLEKDLNANLSEIPENVHILKLDYDTETELKKKYKVIRQHTMVVVDADGNEIKKLTGLTNTLNQVLSQL